MKQETKELIELLLAAPPGQIHPSIVKRMQDLYDAGNFNIDTFKLVYKDPDLTGKVSEFAVIAMSIIYTIMLEDAVEELRNEKANSSINAAL